MKKKCPHLDGRPLWISSGDADRESASGQQMPKLAVHVKRQGQEEPLRNRKRNSQVLAGFPEDPREGQPVELKKILIWSERLSTKYTAKFFL